MKCILLLICILIIFSCQQAKKPHSKRKEKLVQEFILEPLQNYQSQDYTEAFFNEDHFSYTYYPADSIKYFHTLEAAVLIDTFKNLLRVCNAAIKNDSLRLRFTDSTFSSSCYEFEIIKKDNQLISEFYYSCNPMDCTWKTPVFKVLSQNILTDKSRYKKQDSLKGKFTFKILKRQSLGDVFYEDTIKIYGLIKTIVH